MKLGALSVELALRLASRGTREAAIPAEPESIFVLRNNDIGDLLVITPLFRALKKRFPGARICAGIGPWNAGVLEHSPFVDEIHPVSAPWHNKQTTRFPGNSFAGWRDSLHYIFRSGEAEKLRRRKFSIGIDVLGSPQGSLLMLRAGIPQRLGVRGYAGGHSACQRWVEFDPALHVGRAALRFAELLGAETLSDHRPELFFSENELKDAENVWRERAPEGAPRAIIAPGGGFAEKCWPPENFARTAKLLCERGFTPMICGGEGDRKLAKMLLAHAPACIDRTGAGTLRQTFALMARAELILCNSSMAMHAGAGLRKRVIAMLGRWHSDPEGHRRQWGYDEDFLMLGPDARASDPEAVIRSIEARGWMPEFSAAAA